jgi:signal transduction histidine kinase
MVLFMDLEPGKHYFKVRAMDRNWNIDPEPALLEFEVPLPWFRETRLILISIAGLSGVLFFAALAINRHRRLVHSYAEVEKMVALRTKQLEEAHSKLLHSEKMNALGTLAAGIAHDFNSILSIIKGSAQIIETNLDDEEKIRTRLDRIKTVVDQGTGIVKAMLGFSRPTEKELVCCDINALVGETVKLLGDRFQREITVEFKPENALPTILGSRDFIQQILINFIFNAADALNGRGKIILRAQQRTGLPSNLVLSPETASTYVFVSVQDFGVGIAPEILPRIFEPFFTTKAFSSRRGTGLGLSTAYEMAKNMGCGLMVGSESGRGSTFTLIIPVREKTTGDFPPQQPEKRA